MPTEIVIGIDFGTTYTGVSWAHNVPNAARGIKVIDTWPDPVAAIANRSKTPSTITYDDNGKAKTWGFHALAKDNPLRWIKLLLQPPPEGDDILADQVIQHTQKQLDVLKKEAKDVVRDYLALLWDFVINNHLRKVFDDPHLEKTFNFRVCITVPAIWEPPALQLTKQALREAGVTWPIDIVTEPQAAALAALSDTIEFQKFQVGDCFVVCDAGGGTVDLISYEITSLQPMQLKEAAESDGKICGSVLLDRAFAGQIAVRVGESTYSEIKAKYKETMMRNFEDGIKRGFSDDHPPDREYTVELTTAPNMPGDVGENIDDGTVSISRGSLEAIFDPVCTDIQMLVSGQKLVVRATKRKSVKAILLVGGFGMSDYLRNHLIASNKWDQIAVYRPDDGLTTVCRGATMWGLEQARAQRATGTGTPPVPVIQTTISKYSCGLCEPIPWADELRIHEKYKVDDLHSGCTMARNQMNWLIRRGDEIPHDQYVEVPLQRYVPAKKDWKSLWLLPQSVTMSVNLYYSVSRTPATRYSTDVYRLCTVQATIPGTKLRKADRIKSVTTGQWMFDAQYHVNLHCGQNALEFSLQYRDREFGSVTASYEPPSRVLKRVQDAKPATASTAAQKTPPLATVRAAAPVSPPETPLKPGFI